MRYSDILLSLKKIFQNKIRNIVELGLGENLDTKLKFLRIGK